MEKVYIVEAVRTPYGKFGGTLKDIQPSDLASKVIKELVSRSGIPSETVDEVHLGCCIHCEEKDPSPVIARQALIKAGLPVNTVSSTVDRACCSSTGAINIGMMSIQLRKADIVIAGGVEVMSRVPHMNRNIRWNNKKLSDFTLRDPLYNIGYKDYEAVAVDAGNVALEFGVSREDQDLWAYTTQQRYENARKQGKIKEEIMPIEIIDKKGNKTIFQEDECPRPQTTMEALAKLPIVYGSPTVTAGNAPGLNDGAAAVMLMSESKVKELNITPLAEIISIACTADKPNYIASVPATVINKVLKGQNLTIDNIKLIEINEAFAAMPLVSSKILGDFNEEKVQELRNKINVNGGAIACGHPTGSSGARIIMTLLYELRRIGGGYGVASICGGLAQGDAVLIKVPEGK